MSSTEQNVIQPDNSRRTIFLIVAAFTALLLITLGYFIMRSGAAGSAGQSAPRLDGALRAGSPDFEKYRALLRLDDPIADEAVRPIGDVVMTLQTTARNFTGRTVNGLEIYAAVVDPAGKPVKERTVIVVPNRQPTLEPNKTLTVPVMLEGMKKTDVRANIKMEVTAIRFQ